MKDIPKPWLKAIPWDRLVGVNQSCCDAQNKKSKGGDSQTIVHELRSGKAERVHELWDQAVARKMTLPEALDLCRKCCDIAPFVFNNGNTFATVAKALLEDWLQTLPAVESQIVQTTISHYVADGRVTRKELAQVLRHFTAKWKINGVEHDLSASTTSHLQAQAQPQISQA